LWGGAFGFGFWVWLMGSRTAVSKLCEGGLDVE
jgi:hypothetical protein